MSSTRHKSRRTLCQPRTVRTCVHSVGMLCGYMPNSSLFVRSHPFLHRHTNLCLMNCVGGPTPRPDSIFAVPRQHLRLSTIHVSQSSVTKPSLLCVEHPATVCNFRLTTSCFPQTPEDLSPPTLQPNVCYRCSGSALPLLI